MNRTDRPHGWPSSRFARNTNVCTTLLSTLVRVSSMRRGRRSHWAALTAARASNKTSTFAFVRRPALERIAYDYCHANSRVLYADDNRRVRAIIVERKSAAREIARI